MTTKQNARERPGPAGAREAREEQAQPVDASRRLARILRDAEVLADEELLTVQQQHPDEFLGDVLVREGILLESYLQGLLIRTLYVPWLAVEGCDVSEELWELLPESFCRQHRLLPISRARDFLTVATVNPLDEEAIEKIRETTGLKVRLVLCSQHQLETLMKATKAKLAAAQNPADEPFPEEETGQQQTPAAQADSGAGDIDLAAKTAELAGKLAAVRDSADGPQSEAKADLEGSPAEGADSEAGDIDLAAKTAELAGRLTAQAAADEVEAANPGEENGSPPADAASTEAPDTPRTAP